MATTIEDVYLHIGNGGVYFRVVEDDKGRCEIVIGAGHFGQQTNRMEILTTPESLRQIGEAFVRASQHEFPGKPYCYSAEIPVYNGEGVTEGSSEPKVVTPDVTV